MSRIMAPAKPTIQMQNKEKEKRLAIKKRFTGISDGDLREFLNKELQKDEDLMIKFTEYFDKDYEVSKSYKHEINSLYKSKMGRHRMIEYMDEVDFDKFNKIAKIKEKNKNYHEAYKIYQDVSESIAENMDHVDDSGGYYGYCFSDAVKAMVSCISRQALSHREKQPYISYMLKKFVEDDPDYFSDDYESALVQICTDRKDLAYWKKMLKPHLPKQMPDKKDWSEHYTAQKIISMQILLSKKLRDKSVQDVYAAYYRDDEDICIEYIRYLGKSNAQKRAQIIQWGLKCHPESTRLKEMALPTLGRRDEQHDMLLKLYLDTQGPGYYSQLKSMPGWRNTFKKITHHFARHEPSALVDIYLDEDMTAEALRLIISSDDLDMLARHQKRLAPVHPDEYFKAYRRLLLRFACSDTGRRHYKEVRGYLLKIKKIPGQEIKFQKLVKRLREQNSARPAFLECLKI